MTDLRQTLADLLQTTPDKLDVRLVAMKLAPACGRCGGSGSYSFNQVDGSTCYGCKGAGHVAPKARDLPATLERTREAVQAGKLDLYLRSLAARKVVKTGKDRVMKAWSESRVAKVNGGISHLTRSHELEGLAELRAANKVMHDAWKRAFDILSDVEWKRKGDPAAMVEAAQAVEDALKTIAGADYEPPAHLVAYSEEQAARRKEAHARRFGYS